MTTAHAPTQAAEFSGGDKQAIVLYAPGWIDEVLAVLQSRPDSYEAVWSFQEERRAHVLTVAFPAGQSIHVALVDGVHNTVLARLARGSALVLSPYPLYKDPPDQAVDKLFDPEESLALPQLPNPLG